MPRDYKKEYKEYHSKPEQKAKRAARGRARYAYEKANGDLPKDVEIDHKKPMRKGGGNAKSNLRPLKQSANRAWRKGKSGYDRG